MDRPPIPSSAYVLSDKKSVIITPRKFISAEPYDDNGNYIILETFWTMRMDFKTGIWYRHNVPGEKEYGKQALITDFASIPPPGRIVMGPDGLYRNDAVNHDIKYMWQGNFPKGWYQTWNGEKWVDAGRKQPKLEVDWEFVRDMHLRGVKWKTRNEMFLAVAVGGWPAWWTVDNTREQYRDVFYGGIQ